MKPSHLLSISPATLPADGIHIHGELPMESFDIPAEDRISAPDPVVIDLHVSPVHGGILAQGTLQTRLRCRCDRCLKYFDHALDVPDFCQFFRNPQNNDIDLTEYVREDILLAFPQHVLCREDCQGLCPNCGANLNVRDCGCERAPEPDSAWAALDDLGTLTEQDKAE
jgi:uncharacterized metal-binding protein YceD (DUF177 family)